MYHRKRVSVFLFALLFVILFGLSGCKEICPRTGRWETEDGALLISFDVIPFEALITINGVQSRYWFGNEYGSNTIELCTPVTYIDELDGPTYQGEIISCSESEWVLSIEGKEYHLHRIDQTDD